jgi:hypothetical protein
MRPSRVQRHDPVADRAVLDADADLDDCARGEIPNDVRDRRRWRAGAGEQIPALDADRLDVDQHTAVGALGIRDVLVAQDVRAAVLVNHRRLHMAQRSGVIGCSGQRR